MPARIRPPSRTVRVLLNTDQPLRVIYTDTGAKPRLFIDAGPDRIQLAGAVEIHALADALRRADSLAIDFTPAPAP
jgi:hypothetical protein